MEENLYEKAWRGFHGDNWKEEIDVSNFIVRNFTEYKGDDSFLSEPSEKTKAIWSKCEKLLEEENKNGGCLDVETNILSGITAFKPGYIDKENEVIVGLQTDEPLKRIVNMYGGTKVAMKALESHGYKLNDEVYKHFTTYRKTHNDGVFDAYTSAIRRARSNGLLTGLPDGYGRGRIIGDYRRIALYGIDKLIEFKTKDLSSDYIDGKYIEESIRLREEVKEQIRALEAIKVMAESYGFDISRPAQNAKEAIQWTYFGYLAGAKENNGAATSIGRNATFFDIYIERDISEGVLTEEEASKAPENFVTKDATGPQLKGLKYRIQVSPKDCLGCGVCANNCPEKVRALEMRPVDEAVKEEAANWVYAMSIPEKDDLMDKGTVKGSQFARPLLEFSGACAGCGETPYIKLITQLFGDRMVIANATGCTSIWGGSAPSIPYTQNAEGKGPAWANSLFEDNAEYGLGMTIAAKKIRETLKTNMEKAINAGVDDKTKEAFISWIDAMNDGEASKKASKDVVEALKTADMTIDGVKDVADRCDFLVKRSNWAFGGDGWAYDIGYGGLDHVIASGQDINIFVLDTEVYSNTGGQSSKATPTAAVAKFAASGKKIKKKDLGLIATTYGYVYVAQIALGANPNQAIKAIKEAESYPGPSLIIAYAPCINHGIKAKGNMANSIAEEKKAVDTGYWHLWRYNPTLKEEGKNPFILDSKEPTGTVRDFLEGENRYLMLKQAFPDVAEELFDKAEKDLLERYENYKRMASTGE